MRRGRWKVVGVKVLVATVVALALFGLLTMTLWNWLAPELFGGRTLSFWQAIGVLVLARMLVGGRGFAGGRHMEWRRRLAERWHEMTPEERELFSAGLRNRGRCGPFDPAAPPSSGPPAPAAPAAPPSA
jgi:hypothetical protein